MSPLPRRMLRRLLPALASLLLALPAAAEPLRIAAAADLKPAMDAIVARFCATRPRCTVEPIYGSSGKFHAQIVAGAPYHLYFSADIAYPRDLAARGLAASPVRPYAVGRLVLWSARHDARRLRLEDLADPRFRRIAIANPRHAPYGRRAEEALRAAGIWERVQPRLVYGENIAQTAQFVRSGNADEGLVALSLALTPELSRHGNHAPVPERLHAPLEQGFIVTRRGAAHPLAREFAGFVQGPQAQALLRRHGFALPRPAAAR